MADEELDLNLGEAENFDDMKDVAEGEDDLEQFLTEYKLTEHLSLFRDQQIDFETLMILTETDLKSLGLPLGPFRKLNIALKKKKKELNMEADGLEEGKVEAKLESDLPNLTAEGSFRVIDESGDDSDAHSVKSDGGKKKDDVKMTEPDKFHPYRYDLLNFQLAEEFKVKVELQEPTSIDTKPFELITDKKRLRGAINVLRKEKIIAVDAKHADTFEKSLSILQISTQTMDYIIDFSKMNDQILKLTDIFTNPDILKVFYDAKSEVSFLQKYYNLFTINAYCVRSAVKELKYETTSLYSLINKYVSYFKPANNECIVRPIRNDVKANLRKETHYLLHVYLKTRNEAIEAGVFENISNIGKSICCALYVPLRERKPQMFFNDFEKFNSAQKWAAEEFCAWRNTVAKDKNVNPNTILNVKDMKQLCLSLPIKREELLAVCDTRTARVYTLKLLGISKTARKKYFNDPKDEGKYTLKAVDMTKATKRPPPKASPRPKPKVGGGVGQGANANNDLKRKKDGFATPGPNNAKKPRFRTRKPNFGVGGGAGANKRKSFDNNKSKSPKGTNFRNPGSNRSSYGSNAGGGMGGNLNNSYQGALVKYPSLQNVWEPMHNNFNNSYGSGGGFKYY